VVSFLQTEQPISSCKCNLALTAGLHNEENFQQNENCLKTAALALHLCECSLANCTSCVTKLKASNRLTHSPFTAVPCVCVCVCVILPIKYLHYSALPPFSCLINSFVLPYYIITSSPVWFVDLGCYIVSYIPMGGWGSSVSTVTSHGWMSKEEIVIQVSAGKRVFLLPCT
jgi:hypothetical protein